MAERFALAYWEKGRRQEALQLTETVVAARKRTLGEERPDTLHSIHDLAVRYSEAGRRQEALQLLETVVAARKRTLGEEIQTPSSRCAISPSATARLVDDRRLLV